MLVNINFGGFYGSLHESLIEDAIISVYGDDNDDVYDAWDDARIKYSKEYIKELNDMLQINMEFITLDSPYSYNYRTDFIVIDITEKDIIKLMEFIKLHDLKKEVLEQIKYCATPYDGYIPYYDYNDYFKKENRHFLVEAIFDVIIKDIIILDSFEI